MYASKWTNPGSHNRLDAGQMENLSSKADGSLVIILCLHLDTFNLNNRIIILMIFKNFF